MKPTYLAICEDSGTTIIGVARTWAWRRTRPSHAPSKDGKPGVSSRSQRWADSIIDTNVAPPEPRIAVELSHSNKVLYCRLIGGPFLRRGPSDLRDAGNSRSSTAYGSQP